MLHCVVTNPNITQFYGSFDTILTVLRITCKSSPSIGPTPYVPTSMGGPIPPSGIQSGQPCLLIWHLFLLKVFIHFPQIYVVVVTDVFWLICMVNIFNMMHTKNRKYLINFSQHNFFQQHCNLSDNFDTGNFKNKYKRPEQCRQSSSQVCSWKL